MHHQGKRVLIFSQFTIMLDQLENFMGMHEYPCERIDGNVGSRDRQIAIDKFTNGELAMASLGVGGCLLGSKGCMWGSPDWDSLQKCSQGIELDLTE